MVVSANAIKKTFRFVRMKPTSTCCPQIICGLQVICVTLSFTTGGTIVHQTCSITKPESCLSLRHSHSYTIAITYCMCAGFSSIFQLLKGTQCSMLLPGIYKGCNISGTFTFIPQDYIYFILLNITNNQYWHIHSPEQDNAGLSMMRHQATVPLNKEMFLQSLLWKTFLRCNNLRFYCN